MRIELACDACGLNRFTFPDDGDDRAEVVCAECGHVVGTMGDLKDAVAQAVIHKKRVPNVRKTVGADDGQ